MKIQTVSVNLNHSLASDKDGRLFSWGKIGPWLGLGTHHANPDGCSATCTFGQVLLPTIVNEAGEHEMVKCSDYCAGFQHSVIAVNSGHVLTCGFGDNGRLGHGDLKPRYSPTVVQRLANIYTSAVSCGTAHTAAITELGQLFTWGCGADFRLGNGSEGDALIPTPVTCLEQAFICKVACGDRSSACISQSGCYIFWGQDHVYDKSHPYPIIAEYLSGFRCHELSIGPNYTFVVTTKAKTLMEKPVVLDPDIPDNEEEFQARLYQSLGGGKGVGIGAGGAIQKDYGANLGSVELNALARFNKSENYNKNQQLQKGQGPDLMKIVMGQVNAANLVSGERQAPLQHGAPPQVAPPSYGEVSGAPIKKKRKKKLKMKLKRK